MKFCKMYTRHGTSRNTKKSHYTLKTTGLKTRESLLVKHQPDQREESHNIAMKIDIEHR